MEFSEIENKVKEFWKKHNVYRVENESALPKYYVLDMFPYPSGAGLHVGHPLGYIASDIVARYKRLKGYNVLHPMGYDSFGLPAEQYAIQTGQHPAITTDQNIKTFREQMDMLGFSFDWSRELRTSDPQFYKWTQWIFIKLFHSWYNKKSDTAESIASLVLEFEQNGNANIDAATAQQENFSAEEWKSFSAKNKSDVLLNYRLAYLADSWVNWCPQLGTVLANDEVKDGVSERGGYPVERKLMKQWSMRITAYAERLLSGLEKIEWSDSIKEAQRNWIGKSEGCSLAFRVSGLEFRVEVFTTRPDTIFGVSFITLAPEHELVSHITTTEFKNRVDEYVHYAKNRSERERMTDIKKITGQFTGAYAEHPFSGKQIPIWIGEYVLATYGTGAVMGVPAHDERDHRFAIHFRNELTQQLGFDPLNVVVRPVREEVSPIGGDLEGGYYDIKEGIICNSDFLNGLKVSDAIIKAIDKIEEEKIGKRKINYKLRDAIFGRQRYWGEPIPIYYDEEGIPKTVDEKDLPLVLPEVDKYLPTEDGEPPLKRAVNWNYRPTNLPKGEAPHAQSSQDSQNLGYETSDKMNWNLLKENSREHRKNPTEAESVLWQQLRDHQLGEHFRRQHAIGNFIVDFVCLKAQLIIEVDGGIHKQQVEEDKAREDELRKFGFRIIRFKNEEVLHSINNVLTKIKFEIENFQKENSDSLDSDRELVREQVLPFGEDLGGAIDRNREPVREQVSPIGGDLEGVSNDEKKFPLELTTMPGWAGSSWYYLRYGDPQNENAFASKESINYWKQIDLYVGGDEHATGHLMYFRFWTKFLFDLGLIPFDEPAKKLVNQGKIQGVSAYVYQISSFLISESQPSNEVVNRKASHKILLSADLVKTFTNIETRYLNN
ncbi:MAG: class I tRNA ligase family protein, partial [Chitinophagales bacterium]|nr:class I tRNA ligase family protein [Chitinophagales bacterium]